MRTRFGLIALLCIACTVFALAGCDSSSTPAPAIPDYTLESESPSNCAEVDATTGAVTSPDTGCHVHIVFTQTYAQDVVRMAITGTFLASEVYPLFFATNSAASNGWVIQFSRGVPSPGQMQVVYCETETCAVNDGPATFSGSYNANDTFAIAAEADRSGASDSFAVWADTTPAATPNGDLTSAGTGSSFSGTRLGVSIIAAEITGVTITTP